MSIWTPQTILSNKKLVLEKRETHQRMFNAAINAVCYRFFWHQMIKNVIANWFMYCSQKY